MKAPFCRLCEHEHWNNQPHQFDDPADLDAAVKEAYRPYRNIGKKAAVVTCNQCVTKDAELTRLRNQIAAMQTKKPKRDRAAYMRDYRKPKFYKTDWWF